MIKAGLSGLVVTMHSGLFEQCVKSLGLTPSEFDSLFRTRPRAFWQQTTPEPVIMEPTTVGSLWLENDLHEKGLEFESHMGRSKKNVRVTSDGSHAEIHEIWTCVAPAAPPLFHAAVNPCLHGESPWNWSCNSVNLRKSTVTWMRRHYVFTVISRWSTYSSTVNVCNINCVIFSDTHSSFGPPILWHSPFHAGVSVY